MHSKPVGMMGFDGKVRWYSLPPVISTELYLAESTGTPPEGILHHALRDQMARDAAEGLRAIEEQQAKRNSRLALEDALAVADRRSTQAVMVAPGAYPRSGDMDQVADTERFASVMQPKRIEFLG